MRSLRACALLAALASRLVVALVASAPQAAAGAGALRVGRTATAATTGRAAEGPRKGGGAKGSGKRSGPESGFSRVRPLLQVAGNISRGDHPVNLAEEHGFHMQLGGSFSLMCTLRLDRLSPWQRIFDFSFEADVDSITAGSLGNTTHVHFTVFRGKHQKSLHVPSFLELHKTVTTLFTVSKDGRMRVWKDGDLKGETEGFSPYFNDRPNLMIGGHYAYKKQFFRGVVGNVKIWNKEIIWRPRPGAKPVNLKEQEHAGPALPSTTEPPRGPAGKAIQSRIAASAAADAARNSMQLGMQGLPDGQIAGPPLPKPPPAGHVIMDPGMLALDSAPASTSTSPAGAARRAPKQPPAARQESAAAKGGRPEEGGRGPS